MSVCMCVTEVGKSQLLTEVVVYCNEALDYGVFVKPKRAQHKPYCMVLRKWISAAPVKEKRAV